MKNIGTILLVLLCCNVKAQEVPTQNIRGRIVDVDTKQPLIGANVLVMTADSSSNYGAVTNIDGRYIINDVPVGKHTVRFTYVGYIKQFMDIDLNSGKETVLNIELEESSIAMDEVVIKATENRGEAMNEMATVSARSFTVDETNRYPGSRSDPARMASNFAGVQGADDSRNDIVVRGNSPSGVLWRIEGIDIPNPNHFAIAGSAGGPVSILNNKMITNSDFYTGAFPAEFGNTISGVFDINLRNGNSYNHEFTGQFGFLGTEVMAEGPLSKKNNSSYLVMGRYSTLSIFQAIGIKIGTDAVPEYGDGAFKFHFPLKNGGNIDWFAIGGASDIDILISDQTEPPENGDLYGEDDRDQYFGTAMAVSGLVYSQPMGDKTFLKATLAGSFEQQKADHEFVVRHIDANNEYVVDSIYDMMAYTFRQYKAMGAFHFTTKLNAKHTIKYGLNLDGIFVNNRDSVISFQTYEWTKRWDYQGFGMIVRPFFQWRYKWKEKWMMTAGLHSNYFSLPNKWSYVEPRFGLEWKAHPKHKLSYGFGLHSQQQPTYIYSYHIYDDSGNRVYHNQDLGLTKSIHNVLSYNFAISPALRINTEIYHQYLYDVPVEVKSSAYSVVNQGSGFARFFPDSLENTGTGYNYGIEITVEKFFDKSFFLLVTGSLYESKYRGSDGVLRNTDYNGNYTINVLGGKEFKFGKKKNHSISAGLKFTYAGGKRYGYVDEQASLANKELIFLDSGYNERQFKDYLRLDLKVNYKFNAKKVTHEIGVDLVNLLNTKNVLGLTYAPPSSPGADPFAVQYQLAFLPIFYYKIDFRLKGGEKISNNL